MRITIPAFLLSLFALSASIEIFANDRDKDKNPYNIYSKESWSEWKKGYWQEVAGPGGWLSLRGLFWLTSGINSIGSDAQNAHQFPSDTPAFLGTLEVSESTPDSVLFETNLPQVLINGKNLKQSELSLLKRDKVSFEHYEFFIIHREKGFAVRLLDKSSENSQTFNEMKFYPFSTDWVIPATLIKSSPKDTIRMGTVYGTTREEKSAGWLEFKVKGELHRLEAVDFGKNTPLYVMFSDDTNGETTYGAGRYIEVDRPIDGNNTIIDFNRAYNPPCAYTPYATCPLTPIQNVLSVKILAGELDFHKK
ncbi:DUF1684 domain-containing protein [Aliikangiella sp. G2MR2-5]|uniref:DUF1684 domain-containing protein n=1 Tax=Aliikangiella sp. G2MR2-5 TaxID=2788943 RepID=UPI0018AC44E2|nr:DUF1684 domain-containing protein [Aliikangiella sp. G2MR2-5]